MEPFKFDKTINVSHLISIIALLGTILFTYQGIVERMDKMEFKVDLMWKQFRLVTNNDKISRVN